MRRRSPMVGLLIAGTLCACAWNPVRNRPEIALVSRNTEQALGAEGAQQVAATVGLVRDEKLTAYVEAIGQRLADQAPGGGDYHFKIADMEVPNAFALPGGWVYVSRGLLALVNSEDELAGVVGHEIGHVAARHAVARISRSAPLRLATGLGAIATGIVSPRIGRLVGGIGTATTDLLMNPYGRGQEREADEIGQRLAAQAGWDPAALAHFLRTLMREEELARGRVRKTGFLSSHPATPQRIAATSKRAGSLTPAPHAPIARDRSALLEHLDGLVLGSDPGAGIVAPGRFTHPDFDVVFAFPEDWEIRNLAAFAGAMSPDGETQIMIQVAGEGTDTMDAAGRFATETDIRYLERPVLRSVNGLWATHATARVGGRREQATVRLMWLATRGHVLLVSGATPTAVFDERRPSIERILEGVRPLSAAERDEIRVTRLRIVPAEAGETPAELAARVESTWSAAVLAMANGVEPDAPFGGGEHIKIAREEAYRPGP